MRSVYCQYVGSEEKLVRGRLFTIPHLCNKVFGEACKNHYKELLVKNAEGGRVSPFGFYSYKANLENGDLIATCLNVKGLSDQSKIKGIRLNYKEDFIPQIFKQNFDSSILNEKEFLNKESKINSRLREIDKEKKELKDSRFIVKDLVHEARQVNTVFKAQTETILSILDKDNYAFNKSNISNHIKKLNSLSEIFSSKMDHFDFVYNPGGFTNRNYMGVYKKFDKVRRVYEDEARKKGNTITVKGQSYKSIYAYDYFDLVPFILLENAIKYSKNNTEILFNFHEGTDELTITVSNKSDDLPDDDLERLFDLEYRGTNSHEVSGTGRGLATVKSICEIHSIEVQANTVNGYFEIILRIPIALTYNS